MGMGADIITGEMGSLDGRATFDADVIGSPHTFSFCREGGWRLFDLTKHMETYRDDALAERELAVRGTV